MEDSVEPNPLPPPYEPPYDGDEMEARYLEYIRLTGMTESFKYACSDSSSSEEELSDLDEWIKVSKKIDLISGRMKKKKATSLVVKVPDQMICDICSKSFYSRDSIDKHMRVHMAKRFKCSYFPCQKQFHQIGGLHRHIKSHTDLTREFVCTFCIMRFHDSSKLKTHELREHGDKAAKSDDHYICSKCFRPFVYKRNLRGHMKKAHGSHVKFSCDISHSKHDSINKLKTHFETNHPDQQLPAESIVYQKPPPISCQICAKTFNSKSSLQKHLKTHRDPTKFQCEICPSKYVYAADLIRHITKSHPGVNVPESLILQQKHCTICFRRFAKRRGLKVHLELHNGVGVPYQCEFCPLLYSTPQQLRGHHTIMHPEETCLPGNLSPAYDCKICEKKCRSAKELRRHLKFHTDKKRKFVCETCGFRFKSNSVLGKHIRMFHPDAEFLKLESAAHRCQICFKTYKNLHKYKEHMKMHSDTNRPYECEACKIRYMNFGDLKKHMRLHHPDATIPENILEQKPSLKCPTCMRMFKCPLKLEQHILLHSGGAEKFQCELCPMLYSNSLVLKQHYSINHRGMPMPLHLTTKIFSNCTICERKCKSASDLENHMKMHTDPNRTIECELCKLRFFDVGNLKKHFHLYHHTACVPEYQNNQQADMPSCTTSQSTFDPLQEHDKPYDSALQPKKVFEECHVVLEKIQSPMEQ